MQNWAFKLDFFPLVPVCWGHLSLDVIGVCRPYCILSKDGTISLNKWSEWRGRCHRDRAAQERLNQTRRCSATQRYIKHDWGRSQITFARREGGHLGANQGVWGAYDLQTFATAQSNPSCPLIFLKKNYKVNANLTEDCLMQQFFLTFKSSQVSLGTLTFPKKPSISELEFQL